MESSKLVEVTRGDMVESIHRGIIAVVDIDGKIIAHKGNPACKTFLRSAAKPLQAVPVLERGAAEHFQFDEAEMAIISASHSGEKEHQRAVKRILEKIALKTDNLLCGITKPLHKGTAQSLILSGEQPGPIHCPCSGKHAGMLALTAYEKKDLDNYYLLDHPTQQIMLATVADFCEVHKDKITIGIDGCGVPVFGMSVKAMALAYANFVNPRKFSAKRQFACNILNRAISNYPHLIAGTGRFTTALLKQLAPKIIAKDGAEGVFCFGIPDKGWGIAIKIDDGNSRALGPVVLSVLEQLGLLNPNDKEVLNTYYNPVVKNFRGEVIGGIKPVFNLE